MFGIDDAILGAVGGKILDGIISHDNASKNRSEQERFAKQGIRWKVADAKAAGLHPLAALGASTASFSPVSVGSDFGSMGQDIQRAREAQATQEERMHARTERESAAATQAAVTRVQVEESEARTRGYNLDNANKELQNQILAADIAKRRNQIGPAVPGGAVTSVPGFGSVQHKPSEITSRDPYDQSRAAGIEPAFRKYEVAPGYYLDLPGQAMGESLEGAGEIAAAIFGLPATVIQNFRNWKENFSGYPPELGPARDGYMWTHKNGVWKEVPYSTPWR